MGLLSHLQDVSIRSLLLASLAAMALWLLRGRRSAAIRHAVWSLVLTGMLLLLGLGPVLPPIPLRIVDSATARIPLSDLPSRYPAAFFIYIVPAVVLLLRVAAGWLLLHRLVRRSTRIGADTYESAEIAVPLAAGCLRPRILLPADWRTWDALKLETVLAHERAHVRRRDALITLAAAINRSLFWFHPLAWWIERKLALLAEQACDDICVERIGDRHRYASLLVDMAAKMEASRGRVLRQALSMAKPSHIRQRIDTILGGRRRRVTGLSGLAWTALLVCSLPVIYSAAAIRLEPQPPLAALPFPSFTPPPPAVIAVSLQHPVAVPHHKNDAEAAIAAAIQKESDPRRKLALLRGWQASFPNSSLGTKRLRLYLNTYSQLNDLPHLLATLDQMGRETFITTLKINPGSDADFSQTLFYYARAATYDGPGSLPVESRLQVDDYIRAAYSSHYGHNEVGLSELKNLAKAMPFPPQAFVISPLPPPNRTYISTLADETSSVHIRNKCPYGLRVDCNGPERKQTWIPPGQDLQLVLPAGTYQIYAADARGVASFTGPGRFDPLFEYAYTLSLKRD
jgi:hypothetical protein